MRGLEASVAFLALGVVRARLRCDRDGLLIFVVGVILFRVAAAVNLLADLLVAAAPVVVLASRVAVSRFAPHTSRGVVVQWRGAGGAGSEDHLIGEKLCVGGRERVHERESHTGFRLDKSHTPPSTREGRKTPDFHNSSLARLASGGSGA